MNKEKAKCYDCGRLYGNEYGFPDLVIPDWAWRAISPKGNSGGLLCPSCICKHLFNAKIQNCPSAFTSGPLAFDIKSWKEKTIKENAFQPQKGVSFFLRLHRHLPDKICDGAFMFTCYYRKDGKPINIANDYVEELQKDPDFRHKEKEVLEAQQIGRKLFQEKT